MTDGSALDPKQVPVVVFKRETEGGREREGEREKEIEKHSFEAQVRISGKLGNSIVPLPYTFFSSRIGRSSCHHGDPGSRAVSDVT